MPACKGNFQALADQSAVFGLTGLPCTQFSCVTLGVPCTAKAHLSSQG